METSLSAFHLAPSLLTRLGQAGFFTVEDLQGYSSSDIGLGEKRRTIESKTSTIQTRAIFFNRY